MMLLVLRNIIIITSSFKVDFQKKDHAYKISESWSEFAKSVIRIIRLMR